MFLWCQALWEDYIDLPRQREKETPGKPRDSQLPQTLLRQTCKCVCFFGQLQMHFNLNQGYYCFSPSLVLIHNGKCLLCLLSAHSSKTHGDESRPELVLSLTLSSLAISVLHIDPLPPLDASPSPLGPLAAHFFSVVGPSHLDPAAFLQSRSVFNHACPQDHLRCAF